MPSLVLIGPAVWPAIARIQTNKQTDRHNAFYMVDVFVCTLSVPLYLLSLLFIWTVLSEINDLI